MWLVNNQYFEIDISSGTTPFQVRVSFDAGEAVMEGDPATNLPAGIIGFSLKYEQQKCT